MNYRNALSAAALTFALLPVAAARPAAAQKAAAKPTAASVLARYVEVTGGGKWEQMNSFTAAGTVDIPAQKVTGKVEMRAKAPGKLWVKQSLPGFGDSVAGFDGATAWSVDPFQGKRTLKGAELSQTKAQAVLSLRPGAWKALYPKAELLGTEVVNGAPAYKVRLSPSDGAPTVNYYDVKSGLQVRADSVVDSPQGRIPVTSYFTDYRAVSGVKVPFVTRQKVGPSEIVITLTDMKVNAPVADDAFKPAG